MNRILAVCAALLSLALCNTVLAGDNAQFVSQTVPPTMNVGATYSVTVVMKNTGTTNWTNGAGYTLKDDTTPNDKWGLTTVPIQNGPITPNHNATFTFNVTAPTTPGTYAFMWRMRVAGTNFFGQDSPLLSIVVGFADNAQFVSQSVPATMTPGQTYPVSVAFLNNGGTTWTTDIYHLGSQNPQDNTTWGLSRVNLGQSVAPNANVTLSFNATAPTLPGSYNFQWKMLRDGVGPFGELSTNQVVVVSTGNNAQFIGQTVPTTMVTGQTYGATVTFKNTGTSTWSPGANYDIASSNSSWNPSHATIATGTTVAPGASNTYSFNVFAPGTPGTYTWQWRSAQEGIESFGDSTALLSVNVTLPPPVQYAYDGLGRLTGVIDSSGNIARYVYDATGNITRIDRPVAGLVAILSFEPPSGPAGTIVTITGAGFSSTPSQNTVSFNGTAAAVSTASANQLVVAVPANATTGPISVTSPNGSDTSVSPFVVQAAPATPSIQSFNPSGGAAGTSVTITGNNFAATTSGNEVKFNGAIAQTSSATPTSITATVPPTARTGHISVRTSVGMAVSSGIFAVPVAGHTLGEVQGGQPPIVIDGAGVPLSVTNTSGTSIGVLTFDGTVGQNLGLGVSSVSYTLGGTPSVTVLRPDGATLASIQAVSTSGAVLTLPTLPLSGTYLIVLAPISGTTASATFTLSSALTGSLNLDAAGISIASSRIGQPARYTFTGTFGKGYGIAVTGLTSQVYITILAPGGSVISPRSAVPTPGYNRAVNLALASGPYTVVLEPSGITPLHATLRALNDSVGSIQYAGPAQTVTVDTAGRASLLPFTLSATLPVSLYVASGVAVTATILDANGNNVVFGTSASPGNYYVSVVPVGLATGTTTVRLGIADLAVVGVGVQPNPPTFNGVAYKFTVNITITNVGSIPFSGTWSENICESSTKKTCEIAIETLTHTRILNPGESISPSRSETLLPYAGLHTGSHYIVVLMGVNDGDSTNNVNFKAVTFP